MRKSDWKYITSSNVGGSASLGIGIGGGGGSIVLQDPRTSAKIKFRYVELGIGAGIGAKVSLGGAEEAFPSDGFLFMTDTFKGVELRADDIEGIFINAEVSMSLGSGLASNALLLGIDQRKYLRWLVTSLDYPTANAALVMSGMTMGISAGIGAMGFVGYLWEGDVIPEAAILELKSIEEATSMKVQYSAREAAPPIILSGDVLFDFDKHNLKPAAVTTLIEVGKKLKTYSGRHFQIQGFADATGGNSKHNWNLSENRAKAVKDWLVSNGFVKNSGISAKGYGIEYPVAPNNTVAGRAKNRRVEIHILRAR